MYALPDVDAFDRLQITGTDVIKVRIKRIDGTVAPITRPLRLADMAMKLPLS